MLAGLAAVVDCFYLNSYVLGKCNVVEDLRFLRENPKQQSVKVLSGKSKATEDLKQMYMK